MCAILYVVKYKIENPILFGELQQSGWSTVLFYAVKWIWCNDAPISLYIPQLLWLIKTWLSKPNFMLIHPIAAERFPSKHTHVNFTGSWRKSQGITKVCRVQPLWRMNACARFYGDASTISWTNMVDWRIIIISVHMITKAVFNFSKLIKKK